MRQQHAVHAVICKACNESFLSMMQGPDESFCLQMVASTFVMQALTRSCYLSLFLFFETLFQSKRSFVGRAHWQASCCATD